MSKIIFKGQIKPEDVSIEDGGRAVIIDPELDTQGGDESIFMRIHSWDEDICDNPMYDSKNRREDNAALGHKSIRTLFGKKVRITVEVLED